MKNKIEELEQEVKDLIEQHKPMLKIWNAKVYYDGFGAPKKLLEVLEHEGSSALKYLDPDLYDTYLKDIQNISGVKNLPDFKFVRKPRK